MTGGTGRNANAMRSFLPSPFKRGRPPYPHPVNGKIGSTKSALLAAATAAALPSAPALAQAAPSPAVTVADTIGPEMDTMQDDVRHPV